MRCHHPRESCIRHTMNEVIANAMARATLEVLDEVRGGKHPAVQRKYDPRDRQPPRHGTISWLDQVRDGLGCCWLRGGGGGKAIDQEEKKVLAAAVGTP